ncbi:SH3 domain-containing protein [Streptomyces sp. CB00455]|uniref:SH3 domain-containing protein n=1 Tax=Streptomyces sp. CB00455 TaxID=1703927 RepID=UPI00093BF3A3|nr:SH3 domain-containing protein [Streptomyces sp. CB00455]
MLKPTRTILALTAGSLVLGLVGAGNAVADDDYARKHATGKVISHNPLKIRSKPTTRSQILGQIAPHSRIEIDCKTRGEAVDGNRLWYRLQDKNENGDNDGRDDDGRENNGRDDDGRDNNGRDDNGRDDDGRDNNGRDDNGRDNDGRIDENDDWGSDTGRETGRETAAGPAKKRKAYGQDRWVSARYVENLSPVKYCS